MPHHCITLGTLNTTASLVATTYESDSAGGCWALCVLATAINSGEGALLVALSPILLTSRVRLGLHICLNLNKPGLYTTIILFFSLHICPNLNKPCLYTTIILFFSPKPNWNSSKLQYWVCATHAHVVIIRASGLARAGGPYCFCKVFFSKLDWHMPFLCVLPTDCIKHWANPPGRHPLVSA